MDRSAAFAGVRARSEGIRQLPRRRPWGVVAARACLWMLIAASAASGLVSLIAVARWSRAPEAHETTLPVEAEGFAQLFVATYLEAGEGRETLLRPFYSKPLSLQGIRPGQRYVVRTATLESAPTGAGSWSVTVAAEILVEAGGGYRRDGVHLFTVSLAEKDGRLTATSLPTETPGSTVLSGPLPVEP